LFFVVVITPSASNQGLSEGVPDTNGTCGTILLPHRHSRWRSNEKDYGWVDDSRRSESCAPVEAVAKEEGSFETNR